MNPIIFADDACASGNTLEWTKLVGSLICSFIYIFTRAIQFTKLYKQKTKIKTGEECNWI